MKKSVWLHINIYGAPFAIGAVWEFCPAWLSIPAILLLAMHWIGACFLLHEINEKEKNT
jgi:hypothetical protein